MFTSAPDILVVLPTLGDRLDFLRETLDSVAVQRETVALTLVVVSPEGATEARSLALEYGAILMDDPRTGISAAINCGLEARTTERYYAWVGDDDLFRPGGLGTLQAMLEADPNAVVAYGGCDYVDPSGGIAWVSAAGKIAKLILPWGPDLIPNPAAMIRFEALRAIGGFREELRYAMDLEAFLALRNHGRFLSTKQIVAAFRWHPESLTVANRKKSSLESEAVKRRHLPRALRPISFLWDYPVRWASSLAARRVTARAKALTAS